MPEGMNEKGKGVLTQEGLKRLQAQLEYFVSVRRNEIADQIAVARGFGDLSENAEYDEAKKEQAKLEEEINRLENTIRNAVVLSDEDITTDRVNVGTVVQVQNCDSGDVVEYAIVGAQEAAPYENRISNESPVGAALIGAETGQVLQVAVPAGILTIKVLSIGKQA
ncbi:MAG: transcription elongation factor GreA [Clostridia bacterium]|nr:transcription elongation factor GreA [Clostridia bacterium]